MLFRSGVSATDNITKLDNSAQASMLQFVVPGTVAGAFVELLADGIVIGSATASGTATAINTNGSFDLLDGTHQITARQTEPGKATSTASAALAIEIDTVGPAVTIDQHSVQADPTSSTSIYYSAFFSEPVYGFATGDITLSGTAGANSAAVGSGTTQFNIAVFGMNVTGTVIATIAAGVATDAAGNANAGSTSTDNTVTFILSAPEIAVAGLGQDIANGDTSPANTDGTDFGIAILGDPVVTRTFTVTNAGTLPLTLGSVSLPAGFALGTDTLVGSLAPGASDTFTVQLPTNVIGNFVGDISFSTNDADENPFHFRISGAVNTQVETKPEIGRAHV